MDGETSSSGQLEGWDATDPSLRLLYYGRHDLVGVFKVKNVEKTYNLSLRCEHLAERAGG